MNNKQKTTDFVSIETKIKVFCVTVGCRNWSVQGEAINEQTNKNISSEQGLAAGV